MLAKVEGTIKNKKQNEKRRNKFFKNLRGHKVIMIKYSNTMF